MFVQYCTYNVRSFSIHFGVVVSSWLRTKIPAPYPIGSEHAIHSLFTPVCRKRIP